MSDNRGRASRQDEVKAERRRRDISTIDGGQALKLGIPEAVQEQLAAEGKTGRWINDVGGRVHDLTTRDDYDRVDGVEARTVVINRKTGETAKAILVAKRTEFLAEDQANREQLRTAKEKAMLTRPEAAPDGEAQLPASSSYVTTDSKFDRGTFSP